MQFTWDKAMDYAESIMSERLVVLFPSLGAIWMRSKTALPTDPFPPPSNFSPYATRITRRSWTGAYDAEADMTPENIRSAVAADGAAITHLLKSIAGVWQAEWRLDSVCRAITAADGLAFVAVEEERVIGFICGHDLGFRAYLSEFVVAESHQRAGIGKALMRVFEEALARRGCRLVVADIFPPAEPFYRACGWGVPSALLLSHRLSGNA